MKKRALLSVSDKTGIVEFATELHNLGYELISTGGTSTTLSNAGLPVTNVSDITGFPECLDGRVKTLHPMVHAGILAIRGNEEHMKQIEELGVTPIDVVAINLYPFKATIMKPDVTLEDAIENIDIGGPTMIRAAAKNWQDVAVVVDPQDYPSVIEGLKNGKMDKDAHFNLALKVFEHTAAYDALIATHLRKQIGGGYPENFTVTYEKVQDMRYGENPHQKAVFYKEPIGTEGTLAAAKQLHGKELSYNNINDANGALDVIKEFGDEICAVAVKHANPCGVATGKTIYEAYKAAHDADPVSIFGGIVALNRPCDKQTAEELAKIFLEIIIAPSFDADALEILTQKKNIRLLELETISVPNTTARNDFKKVAGGLLVQELNCELFGDEFTVVTDRQPTDKEMQDMKFAWHVVKHAKSNGIVLAKDNATTGIGPGQTNRITALELAIKYAGENAEGSVVASDAFFPFRDCVDAAAKAGIKAIIQTGGSIRDEESIQAANEHGITMVFTGVRHFKH